MPVRRREGHPRNDRFFDNDPDAYHVGYGDHDGLRNSFAGQARRMSAFAATLASGSAYCLSMTMRSTGAPTPRAAERRRQQHRAEDGLVSTAPSVAVRWPSRWPKESRRRLAPRRSEMLPSDAEIGQRPLVSPGGREDRRVAANQPACAVRSGAPDTGVFHQVPVRGSRGARRRVDSARDQAFPVCCLVNPDVPGTIFSGSFRHEGEGSVPSSKAT